jgi:hypothetical protein
MFCSIVGQAIFQTARGIGPSTIDRSKRLEEFVFADAMPGMLADRQPSAQDGAGELIR